jgi:hypothetical protein
MFRPGSRSRAAHGAWPIACYAIDLLRQWRIITGVVFIETTVFTKQVGDLLSDDEYALLQEHLASDPTAGSVIQGTGGLRKIRWAAMGKGKRSGVRIIYFYVAAAVQIRLLLIYRKGIKDDLTAAEKASLRAIVERW